MLNEWAGKSELSKEENTLMIRKIKELKCSNAGVIKVNEDDNINVAITKMAVDEYSQLAVISSDDQYVGIVSWASIGHKLKFSSSEGIVKDFMDTNIPTVKSEDNLMVSFDYILKKEFVLVEDHKRKIVGRITNYDLAEYFRDASKGLIMLNHIENDIRDLISGEINMETINASLSKKKKVKSIIDMTFFQYMEVLEKEDNWNLLKLNGFD